MKRAFVFLLSLLLPAVPAVAQQKPRIAVFSLEFATVKSEADAAFGTSIDVGKGAADLIVDALVKSEKLDVYEREQLEKIVAEQDITNTSRFDAPTAAKIGRNAGVQAVVIGSITKLGQHVRNMMGFKQSEAVMDVTARVVDTSTGKILFTVKGSGETRRKGISIKDVPIPGGKTRSLTGIMAASAATTWVSEKFKESLIGTVMTQAAERAASDVVGQLDKIPAATSLAAGLSDPTTAGPAPALSVTPPSVTPPPVAIAPLTEQVLVEMVKNKVPEPDVIEIVRTHQNFAIAPLEPSWAIAVAVNKVPATIQNAVRARANLPPLQAARPK